MCAAVVGLAAPRASGARGPRKWAVIVGVDRYDSDKIPPLNCAGADALLVAKALEQAGGFDPDDVAVMTAASSPEDQPTSTHVLERLNNMRNDVRPGDTFVFFFSGHGVMIGDKSYLLTQDASVHTNLLDRSPLAVKLLDRSTLVVADVRAAIGSLRASKVLMLVDCCRSLPARGRGLADNKLGQGLARDLRLTAGRGVTVAATLFSCSPGQRSYEGYKGHGYFSYFLDRGLRGAAAGPDRRVTLAGLAYYLKRRVPQTVKDHEGTLQTPMLAGASGMEARWVLAAAPRPHAASAAQSSASEGAAALEKERREAAEMLKQARAALQQAKAEADAVKQAKAEAATGDPVQSAVTVTRGNAGGVSTQVAVPVQPAVQSYSPPATSSLSWRYVPGKSIGPFYLGMSRSDVLAVVRELPATLEVKTSDDLNGPSIFWYGKNGYCPYMAIAPNGQFAYLVNTSTSGAGNLTGVGISQTNGGLASVGAPIPGFLANAPGVVPFAFDRAANFAYAAIGAPSLGDPFIESSAVRALAVTPASPFTLTRVSDAAISNTLARDVAVDPAGKFVFVSSVDGAGETGTVDANAIGPDGSLVHVNGFTNKGGGFGSLTVNASSTHLFASGPNGSNANFINNFSITGVGAIIPQVPISTLNGSVLLSTEAGL